MLVKLLKYEIKATARIFIPFYLFLILFTLINKIFISMNSSFLDIPKSIAMGIFVFTVIGIFVMTLIMTIQRFYKNLLTDEGYLSFTLPVKSHHHIISKAIVALMWFFLDVIIIGLAIFFMVTNVEVIANMIPGINYIIDYLHEIGPITLIIAMQILIIIIMAVFNLLIKIYAAISMTNFTDNYKILLGLGSYIGFDIAEQTITSLLFILIGVVGPIKVFELYNLNTITPGIIITALFCYMILLAIIGSVYFFITNWILKNKLNLE